MIKNGLSRNKWFYGLLIIMLILFLGLLGWRNNLANILYDPLITPQSWLEIQPWIEITIFSKEIIIMQPSSSIFVFSLGILTIIFGISLIRHSKSQKSHVWWGISLILWGLGALVAGISYQAFSYEIKCKGNEFCQWTSWWEIIYLLCSVASIDAMLMGISHSSINPKKQHFGQFYAFLNLLIYLALLCIGIVIPVPFLVSFEFMVLMMAPTIIFFLIVNILGYTTEKNVQDLTLIKIWCGLGMVMMVYFICLYIGMTDTLWEHGIWFSENDVLHLGLILWMIYIWRGVSHNISDFQKNP